MTVTDRATMAAVHRYENELLKLKTQREEEKAQFYGNLALSNV
jgi:phosphatidylethanolamine-binding protein (PEBP) family uncharacterized protein